MFAKDIKHIKDIVEWLNEEYPTEDGEKRFIAYFEKGDSLQMWHVACNDYWIWSSEDFKDTSAALREAYPNMRFIVVCLNFIGKWLMDKKKETQQGKPVIIVR